MSNEQLGFEISSKSIIYISTQNEILRYKYVLYLNEEKLQTSEKRNQII